MNNAAMTGDDWSARVNAGAQFSIFVHALAFTVINLLLFGLNWFMVWIVDADWWFLGPLAWWGSALLIHAVVVAMAKGYSRMRVRPTSPA